ncbi:hypothetical protein LTR08_003784 [Meristemomyces frigidus]|nr:hypothetical protein LTR08_003784 [Meristemomyces frigidus]
MARTSWFVGGTRRKARQKRSHCTSACPILGHTTDCARTVGAGFNATDPDEERDPPPQPTPITFPVSEARSGIDWGEPTALPDLQSLFARVVRPSDVSRNHADALNIETCPPCSVEDLLPDGTSYWPSLEPQQLQPPVSYADATRVESTAAKKRREFSDRLTELQVDNDTAYRTISRTLKAGTKGPRLAYMRKFWEGLESMSQYWDCSLDQYSEVAASPTDSVQGGTKRQRTDLAEYKDRVPTPISEQIDADLEEFANAMKPWHDTATAAGSEADTPKYGTPDRTPRTSNIPPPPVSRTRYRGRRTNTGRDMPDQFRADTVKSFVEGIVWPFQCSLAQARQMPRVQFGKLSLPVRQTAAVYRIPRDRARARQGRLEGPMLALQVRAETGFGGDEGGELLREKARLDLMREVGGLLQIAQERRRGGRTEVRPGEGRWWTVEPRWGGGGGGEVDGEGVNSDVVQSAEGVVGGGKEARKKEKEKAKERGRGPKRRKSAAMMWEELRCGSGVWDPKTDYAAIGKDASDDYDTIFLLSSLNHHLSILKLTVHTHYTDCLISGRLPEPLPLDPAWCIPKLQRTEWFDLFDCGQRVEAFRGVWGVMGFLTRDLGGADTLGGGVD